MNRVFLLKVNPVLINFCPKVFTVTPVSFIPIDCEIIFKVFQARYFLELRFSIYP